MREMMMFYSVGTRMMLMLMMVLFKVTWICLVLFFKGCAYLLALLMNSADKMPFDKVNEQRQWAPDSNGGRVVVDPRRFATPSNPSGSWGAAFFEREAQEMQQRQSEAERLAADWPDRRDVA